MRLPYIWFINFLIQTVAGITTYPTYTYIGIQWSNIAFSKRIKEFFFTFDQSKNSFIGEVEQMNTELLYSNSTLSLNVILIA